MLGLSSLKRLLARLCLCCCCCRLDRLAGTNAWPSPPRSPSRHQRLRRPLVKAALVVALLLMALVLTLHYRVLPSVSGSYNDDCLLREDRRERMRFALRHVINFLNSENATYWLDYGTLLGVVREGDIMAHDGDVDVSRLADNLEEDR